MSAAASPGVDSARTCRPGVALIVILCIAIVVVAALLYRNRDCGGKMEHFDRPGEPKDDLSPVMHGGFINSSFHNASL